jgi:hypothetical protein
MITIPAPKKLHGENIRADLEAAGWQNVSVILTPEGLEISASDEDGKPISDSHKRSVSRLVEKHSSSPTGDEARRVEARRSLGRTTKRIREGKGIVDLDRTLEELILVLVDRGVL